MVVARPAKDLDERIIEQDIRTNLDTALSGQGARYLYVAKGPGNPSYKIDNGKIIKFWEGSYAKDKAVTSRIPLTRDEFLSEVEQMPHEARQQIYENLKHPGQRSTTVRPKEEQSRIPRDLFGY